MADWKQKGRADAARGEYNPPHDFWFKTRTDKESKEHHEYREGHADKKREMK